MDCTASSDSTQFRSCLGSTLGVGLFRYAYAVYGIFGRRGDVCRVVFWRGHFGVATHRRLSLGGTGGWLWGQQTALMGEGGSGSWLETHTSFLSKATFYWRTRIWFNWIAIVD